MMYPDQFLASQCAYSSEIVIKKRKSSSIHSMPSCSQEQESKASDYFTSKNDSSQFEGKNCKGAVSLKNHYPNLNKHEKTLNTRKKDSYELEILPSSEEKAQSTFKSGLSCLSKMSYEKILEEKKQEFEEAIRQKQREHDSFLKDMDTMMSFQEKTIVELRQKIREKDSEISKLKNSKASFEMEEKEKKYGLLNVLSAKNLELQKKVKELETALGAKCDCKPEKTGPIPSKMRSEHYGPEEEKRSREKEDTNEWKNAEIGQGFCDVHDSKQIVHTQIIKRPFDVCNIMEEKNEQDPSSRIFGAKEENPEKKYAELLAKCLELESELHKNTLVLRTTQASLARTQKNKESLESVVKSQKNSHFALQQNMNDFKECVKQKEKQTEILNKKILGFILEVEKTINKHLHEDSEYWSLKTYVSSSKKSQALEETDILLEQLFEVIRKCLEDKNYETNAFPESQFINKEKEETARGLELHNWGSEKEFEWQRKKSVCKENNKKQENEWQKCKIGVKKAEKSSKGSICFSRFRSRSLPKNEISPDCQNSRVSKEHEAGDKNTKLIDWKNISICHAAEEKNKPGSFLNKSSANSQAHLNLGQTYRSKDRLRVFNKDPIDRPSGKMESLSKVFDKTKDLGISEALKNARKEIEKLIFEEKKTFLRNVQTHSNQIEKILNQVTAEMNENYKKQPESTMKGLLKTLLLGDTSGFQSEESPNKKQEWAVEKIQRFFRKKKSLSQGMCTKSKTSGSFQEFIGLQFPKKPIKYSKVRNLKFLISFLFKNRAQKATETAMPVFLLAHSMRSPKEKRSLCR